MLRSPTHALTTTIPLTHVHAQCEVERRPLTGAQLQRKLYHDHYQTTSATTNYQQQHQQHQKQQLQKQQQHKQDHFVTKSAKTTTTCLISLARTISTETKTSDADSGNNSSTSNSNNNSRKSTTTTAAAQAATSVKLTTTSAITNSNSVSKSTRTTQDQQQREEQQHTLTNVYCNKHISNFTKTTATSLATPSKIAAAATTTILSASHKPTTLPAAATTATTTTTTGTTTKSSAAISMSPTSQTPSRTSLFDSCHRKIRLIGGGPVAFLGGLVAKARRKERDGDQNSTDTKLYLEESVLERKLPEADLKALVDLPAGLDYNEWLASHTLALFEHVNLVYGTVSEFCTPSGCPDMTGPANRTYLWFDEKGKKTRVAAPQYIDYVMTFTQKTVSDESIFPTKYANEFPSSFESIARKILRLQFNVIAHLYAAHFREIALLGLHTHLNLTFAHLTALHRRFNLIDEKETDVLRDLEVALRLTDDNAAGCGGGGGSSNNNNSSSSNASHASTTTTHHAASNCSGDIAYESGNNYASSQALNACGHQTSAAQLMASATSDDVQQQHTTIDGDASTQPICTQPEAKACGAAAAAGGGGANNVFGGGGGLMGGILGDFTGSEFSDTTRYCTSAVPSTAASCNNATAAGTSSSSCMANAAAAAAAAANSNNGAGALQLNFTNNYHAQHHQHHLHQQQQHLHQCNNTSASPHNTTTTA